MKEEGPETPKHGRRLSRLHRSASARTDTRSTGSAAQVVRRRANVSKGVNSRAERNYVIVGDRVTERPKSLTSGPMLER